MDDYDIDSNYDIKDEANGQSATNNSDTSETISDGLNSINLSNGNGYNGLASSNREAFTRGLNNNYAERIARNKTKLQQARARSNEPQKKNGEDELKDKNILDKTQDKANLLKSKAFLLSSQIDNARSNAYQISHPVEAAKVVAKEAIKKKVLTWVIGTLPIWGPFLLMLLVIIILLVITDGTLNLDGLSPDYGTSYKSQECGFTISATSLSKSEYKEKLEEYAEAKNSKFQIFADNAEDIYEYAQSKNVNPELVVVRAYVEGKGNTTGSYNYWGMGCTNTGGLKACYSYYSFEEGYISYINNISKYDSLADMMSKYAYIGEYWYNPGSSSVGGCYYAEYIYNSDSMPIRVKNACSSSAPTCSTANKTNCTKTTDEDQSAYATWQVEQSMANARYTIFGLKIDEGPCTYNSGTFQHLSTYNLKHNNLTVLNRTLTTTEINNLNNYIYNEIDSAGYGTGNSVAAAGQALVYGLEQMGYYLQYQMGGGHADFGDRNSTFVGVNSNWGSTAFGKDYQNRKYLGMDCSGFVSWTIRTACNPSYGTKRTATMVQIHKKSINISEAKPGDLMLMNGHVRLVIKNNGDGTVIVAEETGGKTSGLVFSKLSTDSNYKFIDMSSYYQKNCKTVRTV